MKNLFSRYPTLTSGLIFVLFSFLNKGINFVLSIVLANYFSPSDYGTLSLFVSAITVLEVIINVNAKAYLGIAYFKKPKEDFYKYVSSIWAISSISFVIILIISLLVPESFVIHYLGFSDRFLVLAIAICFFQNINNVNLDYQRLKERPVNYGLLSSTVVFGNFLLTLILLHFYKTSWFSRVYAQICIAMLVSGYSIWSLKKENLIKTIYFNKKIIKEILIYSLPLVPHAIAGWLCMGFNKNIINYNYSPHEVGIYSFASMLASIILVIGIAFNASNSVDIYKSLSQGDYAKLNKNNRLVIIFFIIVLFAIIASSYLLIKFIFIKYKDSTVFLPPLCLSAFVNCIYFLYCNYLFYFCKTKTLMTITFTSSFISALISMCFTKYSMFVPAYTELFTNICVLFFVYLYSKRLLKENTPQIVNQ